MSSNEDDRDNADYRNLIDSIGISLIFLDRGLRVSGFSERAGRMFGLAESDIGAPLTGRRICVEHFDPGADAAEVLETGRMVEREVRSADGPASLIRMTPALAADKTVNGVIVALIDISNLVKAEAWARYELTVVSEIVENMGEAFFAVDRNWRLNYANRRAEQMWGLSREGVLGQPIWEVIPGAESSELVVMLRTMSDLQAEEKFEAFSTILNIWMQVRVHPTADGLAVYIRDITERKRRDENLAFIAEINKELAMD